MIIWNVQIIKTKIFELPFKTFYNTTEINMTNYMAINFKSRIGIEIELGTPPQKLNASFHLQLFYTIVQTTETKCKLTSLFNTNNSITFKKDINSSFFVFEPFRYAYHSEDKAVFSNKKLKIDKFNFLTTVDLNDNSILNPIILGLRLKPNYLNKEFKDSNIINYLHDNKYSDNYVFTFDFSSIDEGKILFGENPYKNEDFLYISVPTFTSQEIGQSWGIVFDNVFYGNINLVEYDYYALIEVEQKFIIGSSKYIELVEKEFFSKYTNLCKKETSYLSYESIRYYVCDKSINLNDMKPLIFYIKQNNFSFIFNPNELFVDYEGKKFFIVTFSNVYNSEWILGRYFLQKYNLYFDKDKKVIGFYRNGKPNNKYISLVFLIILSIIIFILINVIYIQVKKGRKKRINELDDGFDYINQIN